MELVIINPWHSVNELDDACIFCRQCPTVLMAAPSARRVHRCSLHHDGTGPLAHVPDPDQTPGTNGGVHPATPRGQGPAQEHLAGTCTEDQVAYDERRPHLLATKAAGRGLSVEPLLGPINFGSMDGLDWIVVGGEPGPGARPVAKEWATGIRNDSQQAGVPFFFKQWGAFNAVARKLARKSSPSLWTAWSTLRSRKSNRGSKIMKNQNNPGIETVPVSTGIEPAIPRVKAR